MSNFSFNLDETSEVIADKTRRMGNAVRIKILTEGKDLVDEITDSVENLEKMVTNALDLGNLKDHITSAISGAVNNLLGSVSGIVQNIAKQALLTEKAEDCGRFVKSVSLQLDKVNNGLTTLKEISSINNMISYQNLSAEANRASKKVLDMKGQTQSLLSCVKSPSNILGTLGGMLDKAGGGLLAKAGVSFKMPGFSASFDVGSIIPPLPQIQLPELPKLPSLDMGNAMKVRTVQAMLDTVEGEVKSSVLAQTSGLMREKIMQLSGGIQELADELMAEMDAMTDSMLELDGLMDSDLITDIQNGISVFEDVLNMPSEIMSQLDIPTSLEFSATLGDLGLSIEGRLDLPRLSDITGMNNLSPELFDVVDSYYQLKKDTISKIDGIFDISIASGAGLPSIPNDPYQIQKYFEQPEIIEPEEIIINANPKSTQYII